MKRTALAILVLTLALVALLTGTAYAEAADPPASAGVPWWAIAGVVALALSEILSLIPSLESNGVVQLLKNIIKSIFGSKD